MPVVLWTNVRMFVKKRQKKVERNELESINGHFSVVMAAVNTADTANFGFDTAARFSVLWRRSEDGDGYINWY